MPVVSGHPTKHFNVGTPPLESYQGLGPTVAFVDCAQVDQVLQPSEREWGVLEAGDSSALFSAVVR